MDNDKNLLDDEGVVSKVLHMLCPNRFPKLKRQTIFVYQKRSETNYEIECSYPINDGNNWELVRVSCNTLSGCLTLFVGEWVTRREKFPESEAKSEDHE